MESRHPAAGALATLALSGLVLALPSGAPTHCDVSFAVEGWAFGSWQGNGTASLPADDPLYELSLTGLVTNATFEVRSESGALLFRHAETLLLGAEPSFVAPGGGHVNVTWDVRGVAEVLFRIWTCP